jgi:RHS repeat-associated protein
MQLISQTATKGSTTLMNLTYNYQAGVDENGPGTTVGNSGQLMSISGTINGTTESAAYTHDLLGRLATSSQTTNGVSAERAFEYDRWGNRTGVWDATKEGNQIQSVALQQSGGAPTNRITSVTPYYGGPSNYTYDSGGNVSSDGAHSYVYDAENRLVATDGTLVTCAYDHTNRRIKKATSTGTRHYVWDGSRVLAEYNGSSGVQLVSYIYAGRMIAKSEAGVQRYFVNDRLSIRLVLDSSGNVVGRAGHLPFGEPLGGSGEQDKHQYTTYERDSEHGIDYAVNRGYSPGTGRFGQSDPYRPSGRMLNPQSRNRYSYVQNDPANLTDPLGLYIVGMYNIGPGCWALNHNNEGHRWVELYGSGCASGDAGGKGRTSDEGRRTMPIDPCDRCCVNVLDTCKTDLKNKMDEILGSTLIFVAICIIACILGSLADRAIATLCITLCLFGVQKDTQKKIVDAVSDYYKCLSLGSTLCKALNKDCFCPWD